MIKLFNYFVSHVKNGNDMEFRRVRGYNAKWKALILNASMIREYHIQSIA
jgi:hypothetical protein